MSEPDLPLALKDELRSLSARQLRDILQALTPAERDRVASLLSLAKSHPQPANDAEAPDKPFIGHSPLVTSRLRDAADDMSSTGTRCKMTPETRSVLLASAREVQTLYSGRQKGAMRSRGLSAIGVVGAWIVGLASL